MNFSMPSTFPEDMFQKFGKLASQLFPAALSNENLYDDPHQKLWHFQKAWLAVLYRYRACSGHNNTFGTLLVKAKTSDVWREWSEGEEHHYLLEQCLYHFFLNALSVIESLVFCLYFVGGMASPEHFRHVRKPKSITLKTTTSAFEAAFPHTSITHLLRELLTDPEFTKIEAIRNILAHRVTGRRNIRNYPIRDSSGKHVQTREEVWYIPGSSEELAYNEQLTHHYFEEITRLITRLISASLEYVESQTREGEGSG